MTFLSNFPRKKMVWSFWGKRCWIIFSWCMSHLGGNIFSIIGQRKLRSKRICKNFNLSQLKLRTQFIIFLIKIKASSSGYFCLKVYIFDELILEKWFVHKQFLFKFWICDRTNIMAMKGSYSTRSFKKSNFNALWYTSQEKLPVDIISSFCWGELEI